MNLFVVNIILFTLAVIAAGLILGVMAKFMWHGIIGIIFWVIFTVAAVVMCVKLSNDLTMKQQEELKKISEAYKKAQIDYGKTARKLSRVSEGNMSASEALRLKENADKQRAKLMEASSKANDFYNNQKKGV